VKLFFSLLLAVCIIGLIISFPWLGWVFGILLAVAVLGAV